MRARRLLISSLIPSAKAPSAESPTLSNGSTAMRIGPATFGVGRALRAAKRAPTTRRNASDATRRRPRRLGGRVVAPGCNDRPSCDAVANRSAGVRASARATAASTLSGTSGRTTRTGVGTVLNRLAMIACAVGPVNGGSPGQHLVEHAAERVDVAAPVDVASPVACSGLMYAGVPSAMPGLRERASPPPLSAPGDAEVGHHRAAAVVSRMFSGLMSRWTTPCRWAYSSACAASRAMRSASSTGAAARARSRSRSDLTLDERHT